MLLRFALGFFAIFSFVKVVYSLEPEMSGYFPGITRIGKQSWGASQQGWRLAFALPKDTYGTNETICGGALLRNETDTLGATVTNSDGAGDYETFVLDAQGKTVAKQNDGLARFANFHSLNVAAHSEIPGFVNVGLWNKLHQPGIYRVTIARYVPNTNGTGQTKVFSATNTFQIVNSASTSTNGEILKLKQSAE